MQFDLEDQRSLLRFVFLAPVLLDGFVVVVALRFVQWYFPLLSVVACN